MSTSEDILTLPAPPADARIAYGTDPLQFGDLRLPAAAGRGDSDAFPLVILIHGGYWRNRYDLAYFGHAAAALTAEGLATWNIEYRRVGDAGGGWPGTLLDVAAATDYAHTLAAAYLLDVNPCRRAWPLRRGPVGRVAGRAPPSRAGERRRCRHGRPAAATCRGRAGGRAEFAPRLGAAPERRCGAGIPGRYARSTPRPLQRRLARRAAAHWRPADADLRHS